MKELAFTILGLSILLGSANGTLAMTAEEVEAAEFSAEVLGEGPEPLVVRLQILLDRHGASPGVIDGYPGENVEEALRAFETMKGLEADGVLDETAWDALVETGGSVTRPMRSWRTTFPDWSRRSRRTLPKWRNGRVGYTN